MQVDREKQNAVMTRVVVSLGPKYRSAALGMLTSGKLQYTLKSTSNG
jgi:hypothetical protein